MAGCQILAVGWQSSGRRIGRMRVLAVGVFASVAALAPTAGPTMAQAGAAGQTVDRTIALTVLDRDGAPVRDLETEDFALTEGGEPRPIVNAALSTDSLEVVVVVNTAQPQGQIRAQTVQSYGVVELPTGTWQTGTLGWLECMDYRPDGNFSGELDCHHAGIVHADATMTWEGIEAPATGNDNVVAATDVALAPLNKATFLVLVQDTPHFALEVMRSLSDRLRAANEMQGAEG